MWYSWGHLNFVVLYRSEDNRIESFTDWMKEFAKSGQVREQDVDIFLKKTDIEYMRGYLQDYNTIHIQNRFYSLSLSIRYSLLW